MMCCALCKPAGVPIPKVGILRLIWEKNPDGAGLCYPENGKLKVRKGFLECEEFIDAVRRIPKSTPALLHMRVATSGGIRSEMTHPFPVWNFGEFPVFTALETECGVALVHNGILPYEGRNGVSDTCELAMRLYEAGGNPFRIMKLIEPFLAPANRIALMNGKGTYHLYGNWTEMDGIYYSNLRWQKQIFPRIIF